LLDPAKAVVVAGNAVLNQNPAVLLPIDLDPAVRADQALAVAAARVVRPRAGVDGEFLPAGEFDLLGRKIAGAQIRRDRQLLFRVVDPRRQRVKGHIADIALNGALHRAAVNAVRPVDKIQLVIRNANPTAFRFVVSAQAEHAVLPAIHHLLFIAFA